MVAGRDGRENPAPPGIVLVVLLPLSPQCTPTPLSHPLPLVPALWGHFPLNLCLGAPLWGLPGPGLVGICPQLRPVRAPTSLWGRNKWHMCFPARAFHLAQERGTCKERLDFSLRSLSLQRGADFDVQSRGVGHGALHPPMLRAAKNDALIVQQKEHKRELFLLSA